MKNTMMRIASILMVVALLTACVISGTFAKYVTSKSAEDTARVAKFGVAVTATGDAFKTEYAKDDTTFELAANTVVSTDKVVAPGTKGTLATIALTGTPEVAVRISFDLTAVKSDNWTVAEEEDYFPLVFKVNGTEVAFEDLADAVAELTFDVEAGTDLSTVLTTGEGNNAKPVIEITWEWPFEVGETADEIAATDAKDTWLGNQAAAGNPATVTVTLTATVTQID